MGRHPPPATRSYDLECDGVNVELEYYEHGQLVAYPLFEEVEDGDVSEPIFSIHDSTPESALREFVAHGFVEGAHQTSWTGSKPSVGFGHR